MPEGEHTRTSGRDPILPPKDPSPPSDDLPELDEWAEDVRRSASSWWSPETKPTARKVQPIFGRRGRKVAEESDEEGDTASEDVPRGPIRFGERNRTKQRREPGKAELPIARKTTVPAPQPPQPEPWPPPEPSQPTPATEHQKAPSQPRSSSSGSPPRRPSAPWRGARQPDPPAPDPEFGSAHSNTPLTASRRQIERPQRDDLLITEMLPESLDMPMGESASAPRTAAQDAAASSWGKRFAHSLSDEEERQRLAEVSAKRSSPSRGKNAAGFIAGAVLAAVAGYALLRFLGYM
ncbi:MAG TPA: hypothetical protein VMN36_08285 [Verrucomicrobiales bacterium]|nr:hypothetical protein [Verrucomicrobiales bacterium]